MERKKSVRLVRLTLWDNRVLSETLLRRGALERLPVIVC